MEKKLQVQNLRISFRTINGKVQAVRDISFNLYKGQTLAIVGESGSGKSVTSKAIQGILAGNSIIEGGEILYDGMDLLKISEEDFYRLRGDKIAMIFQDPLSSLNPIMRIGKQLTEAMLLKSKARQRESKKNFNDKLQQLEKLILEAEPSSQEETKALMQRYRRYVDAYISMKQPYLTAMESLEDAREKIDEAIFLIEKNAFTNGKELLMEIRELLALTANPHVLSQSESALLETGKALLNGFAAKDRKKDFADILSSLKTLKEGLANVAQKPAPDLDALAYQKSGGGNIDSELRAPFIRLSEKALRMNDKNFVQKRANAIGALEKGIRELENGSIESFRPGADGLMQAVSASINPIDVIKDSMAYTFQGSMKAYLAQFDEGRKNNAKKERKYQAQLKRHQTLTEKGKQPDWVVVAPTIVDFDLLKQNMLQLMLKLKNAYEEKNALEPSEDKAEKANRLENYLRENAEGMVYSVSKAQAKSKALKLMAEVGIPEPRRRYRQYPFEFSGGMRQRIVIAIALAANPDILICDEPTTALDVTIQAQILELINELKRRRNLSIIFITHDLGVVANMADQIAVMYAGKIVEYGTSEEIFYSPAHPYTWALLSSMPDLETKEKLEAIPGTPPNMIYPPKGDAFADRNKYAMQIDFEEQPPIFHISDTHWAATWLLHPDAPKVEPPQIVINRIKRMKDRLEASRNV